MILGDEAQSLFSVACNKVLALKQFSLLDLFDNSDLSAIQQNKADSLTSSWINVKQKDIGQPFLYQKLRICPTCSCKDKVHLPDWQNPFQLGCSACGTLLEDSCGKCNKPLDWRLDAISGKCTTSGCSALLKARAVKDVHGILTEEQVKDCINAYLIMFSYKSGQFADINGIKSLNIAITIGHHLLCNKSKCDDLIQELFDHYFGETLPSSFYRFPAELMLSQLNYEEWPVKQYAQELLAKSRNYSTAFRDHNLYMTVTDLCKCSGLDRSSLDALETHELVTTKTSTRVTNSSLLRLNRLIEKLNAISHNISSNTPTLSNCQNRMGNIKLDPILIVEQWLEGRLEFSWYPGATLIDSVFIAFDDFQKVIVHRASAVTQQVISCRQAEKLLGIGRKNLLKLINDKRLRALRDGERYKMRLEDVAQYQFEKKLKTSNQLGLFN